MNDTGGITRGAQIGIVNRLFKTDPDHLPPDGWPPRTDEKSRKVLRCLFKKMRDAGAIEKPNYVLCNRPFTLNWMLMEATRGPWKKVNLKRRMLKKSPYRRWKKYQLLWLVEYLEANK